MQMDGKPNLTSKLGKSYIEQIAIGKEYSESPPSIPLHHQNLLCIVLVLFPEYL